MRNSDAAVLEDTIQTYREVVSYVTSRVRFAIS